MTTASPYDEIPEELFASFRDYAPAGVGGLQVSAGEGSSAIGDPTMRIYRKNSLADLALELSADESAWPVLDRVRSILDDGDIPTSLDVFIDLEAELDALYKKLVPDAGDSAQAPSIDLRYAEVTKDTLPAVGLQILKEELAYCRRLYTEWNSLCSPENINRLSLATNIDLKLVFQYISNQADTAQIVAGENKAAWSGMAMQSTLVYMLQSDNAHLRMLGSVTARDIQESLYEADDYSATGRYTVDFEHGRYGAYFTWSPNDRGEYETGRLVINSQSFAFQSSLKRALLLAHECTHHLEAVEPTDNVYELVNPVNSERAAYATEYYVLEEHIAKGHYQELGSSEQQFLRLVLKYNLETVSHAMAVYHVSAPNLNREEILLKVAEELGPLT